MQHQTLLITGVTGFLGGHMTLEALRQGHTVRGTLRSMERAESVREMLASHLGEAAEGALDRLTFHEADLLSPAGWREAAAGCDAGEVEGRTVFTAAGLWPGKRGEVARTGGQPQAPTGRPRRPACRRCRADACTCRRQAQWRRRKGCAPADGRFVPGPFPPRLPEVGPRTAEALAAGVSLQG